MKRIVFFPMLMMVNAALAAATPLLPLPEDTYPNVKENIQRVDPGFSPRGHKDEAGQQFGETGWEGAAAVAPQIWVLASQRKAGLPVWGVGLAFLAAGGLLWWYVKKK